MDAFKAGGGNAALQALLKRRAGAANAILALNQDSRKPANYTKEQIASARRVIEARGRRALAAQNKEQVAELGKGKNYTYTGTQAFYKGKLYANLVDGKWVRVKKEKAEAPEAPPAEPDKNPEEAKLDEDSEKGFVADRDSDLPDAGGSMPEIERSPVPPKKLNTTETIAAGKNPMHVWALANEKMITRNQNAKELQILKEAKQAKGLQDKLQINSAEAQFTKPQRKNELMSDSRTSFPTYS